MLISQYCDTDYKTYDDFYRYFQINIPENFNFAYDVTDKIAHTSPDKTALVWCNDRGDERLFTFGEIKALSDRCANMLLSNGIKKGDFVMTMLKRHHEYWVVSLALHKIGAVLIPATYMLTKKDLVYRIEATDIKAVVTTYDEQLLDSIDAAQAATGGTLQQKILVGGHRDGYINYNDAMAAASPDFVRPTGDGTTGNDDLFIIYFTSGTTGLPKMAAHTYTYPLGHILTAKFWQNLNEHDLHFVLADTAWAKHSWSSIYGQWMSEAALFVYDYDGAFKPDDLLSAVSRYNVTVFCAPPTTFRFLIKTDVSQYDLSSLRHCCTAGEPLNAEVFNKWKEYTGLEIREGFGQTESSVLIATYPWLKPRPGSLGKFSPHYKIKLLGDDGNEVEIGDEGEICIDISDGIPAGLTIGYYRDAQKTAEVMHGGMYHTGDKAWRDEDGYIWFVGRNDDVIKSSGYRISPFEVESALVTHPAVLESAVTAVPDPDRGQIVKASVVLAAGQTPSDELKKELQNHVKKTTAPYKYPRIVEFVTELPKTIGGKIKRAEIRKADENA